MSEISTWPNTANGFNSLTVPDSAPELGTTVAQINDVIREVQGGIRREYEIREWRSFGYTITTNSSNSIDFGEAIPLFVAGQRVKVTDNSGILYATINSNIGQTLTLKVDGGASLTTVTEVEAGLSIVGDPTGIQDQLLTGVTGNLVDFDSNGDMQDSGQIKPALVTSPAQTVYVATTNWTSPHGRGSRPDLILGYAVKNANGGADGGYSNGDKVMLDGTNFGHLSVWADSTVLGGVIGTFDLSYTNKTTGDGFTLAVGEWDVFIEGVWFT